MRSSFLLLMAFCQLAGAAAVPKDRQTIYTSGEKVFTIHYQLGQSTVLSFGFKPETVICGNKNYFSIDKIKEGITIQPLSNFSTNLVVFHQGRQYLFYLVPANGTAFDSFIDVRWIPKDEKREVVTSIAKDASRSWGRAQSLNDMQITPLKEIIMDAQKRSLFEFEIKNQSRKSLSVKGLEIVALRGSKSLEKQTVAIEKEQLEKNETTRGRLIVSGDSLKQAVVTFNDHGKQIVFKPQGAGH